MRVALVLLAALALLPTAVAASAALHADMAGSAEVPPNASPASGVFDVVVDDVANTACWTMSWSGLSAASTAAHIHEAPPGVAGPIRVPLSGVAGMTSGNVNACEAITNAIAMAIIANPAAYYVNLHTSAFPGGEIRGQLAVVPPPPPVPELPALALVVGGALVGLVFLARRTK